MNRIEMTEILTTLGATYRDFPITRDRLEAWMIGCAHQDSETMKRAAYRYIQTEKWPPSPADINHLIGGQKRPASLIWSYMIEEANLRRSTNYFEDRFQGDQATLYAVKALGGWQKVKGIILDENDNLEFFRKDFHKYHDEIDEYKFARENALSITNEDSHPERKSIGDIDPKVKTLLGQVIKGIA